MDMAFDFLFWRDFSEAMPHRVHENASKDLHTGTLAMSRAYVKRLPTMASTKESRR
jgi:hypothetical protein